MMPVSQDQGEDRTRLDGFEIEILKLVKEEATSEQWKEWLRVPLEHAAAKGNMELFTRLMDAGADGSAGWRGCLGRTLLGSAAGGGSEEMVLALLKAGSKGDLNAEFGAKSESALHVAAARGAEGVCAMVLLAGADPGILDIHERSPLHVAAEAGHHGIVRELLLTGACPEAKTQDVEFTSLHLAALKGHTQCVATLLLGGADKDSLSYNDETPLHLAAGRNQVGAVEDLLSAGANLDIRNISENFSPLDVAAYFGHEDAMQAILRKGGNSKACDVDGHSVLHHAAWHDGDVHDNGGVVRMLVEAGADIEAKTAMGYTPLRSAIECQSVSSRTAHALLKEGADVNAMDNVNWTPLHGACGRSNVACVEVLLRWGADEMLTNEEGLTAAGYLPYPDDDVESIEKLETDNEHIRHMLARAPSDRCWRRRGWLVLCRHSTATQVQLATNSRGGGSKPGGAGTGDEVDDVCTLVRRVVDLEEEDVFRMVVGFL